MSKIRRDKALLHVRPLELRDIDKIFLLGSQEKEFKVSTTSTFWTKDELLKWIKNSNDDVLFVAEVNNEIVGFVLSYLHKPNGVATITNIYVIKTYRGQGIGKTLINESVNKLKEKGATYIKAEIEVDNRASVSLFKECGFNKGSNFTWMEGYT